MKPLARRLLKILAALVATLLVVHAVLLLLSGLALRNAYEELREAGRPMALADIIPTAVPAAENAAPLYESAFALFKSESLGDKELGQALGVAAREYSEEPDSDDKREALEALLSNETVVQALALVHQAAARPRCNFDLQYDQGAAMLVPHVHGFLTVGRVLAAKTLLEIQQGNRDQARQTAELALRMADALHGEPVLISALVRIAQYQMALASVRQVAAAFPPDDATAVRLEKLIAPADDPAPFLLAMDGERLLMGEWAFQHMAKQNITDMVSIVGEDPDWTIWKLNLLIKYPPARQADHALYLRTMLACARDFQRPYWETRPGPDEEPDTPWYGNMTRIILPAFSRARIRMVMTRAQARVARTGLALLRHKAVHGAYPAALANLDPQFLADIPLDPFTGRPLVYRPEADGFVLYSLGENLADDGGAEKSKDTEGAKAYDIVWRMAN